MTSSTCTVTGPPSGRSQINAPDAGTLGRLASYRVFGKPFVVSEYASAAPNDYAAEMFPLLIGIAGLQDWDAVFAFAYADQKRDYQPTRINGVFDLAGHPAKLAFLSTAAAAFRRGLVAPRRVASSSACPSNRVPCPLRKTRCRACGANTACPLAIAAIRQLGITLRPGSGEITASYAARRQWHAGQRHRRVALGAAGQPRALQHRCPRAQGRVRLSR